MPVPVLYEDERLLVCVKPAGLISERGGLPELLEQQRAGLLLENPEGLLETLGIEE